jgi:predicted acetyltransferase
MEVRKINESEREQVLLGDRYAYANWTEDQISLSSLETTIPDQTLGAFVNGKVVASLRIHPFQQSIRSVVKEMGGIGGVWTYPEYRNRGYVKELLNNAFKAMKARGQGVSMLIPFKQSFYQKFGYVTANSNLEVRIPISSINSCGYCLDWEFERINASEVHSEFAKLSLEKQYHGIILPVYWSSSQWDEAISNKQCVLVKYLGKIIAVGIYRIDSKEKYIKLDHFFWSDLESRIKLFGFFANHRDQINYIYLDLPFGISFYQWFGDVAEYKTNIVTPPYMVRVIDIETAINDLPTQRDGIINMQIEDLNCDWNSDIFILESQNYILNVKRSPDSKPDIKCTIQGISALVYGTLDLAEIEYREWLKIIDENRKNEWRSLLQSWFSTVLLYNTWKF